MTLHVAVTFFDEDKKSMGYVIGSDSLYVVTSTVNGKVDEFAVNLPKLFKGKDYVGFQRGRGFDIATMQKFQGAKLSEKFDDIEHGKKYDDLETLLGTNNYQFLIAKRNPDALELYEVSNSMANRIDKITLPESFSECSTLWIATPIMPTYRVMPTSDRLDFQRAKTIAEHILKDKKFDSVNLDRDCDIYSVTFDGISEVKRNNMEIKPVDLPAK